MLRIIITLNKIIFTFKLDCKEIDVDVTAAYGLVAEVMTIKSVEAITVEEITVETITLNGRTISIDIIWIPTLLKIEKQVCK